MNNGHNLSFERSSGYGGYRCENCGQWFHAGLCDWNDLKPCRVYKGEPVKTVSFPTSIHSPSDIEVGKKYENSLCYGVTYLGCENYDTKEKFMVIISQDGYEPDYGKSASNNVNFPIWKNGFQLQ